MAETATTRPDFHAMTDAELDAYFAATDYYVTPEDGRRMFDAAARRLMGMSGEEFIRRWEAGEFDEVYDKPGYLYIGDLAALISFARQDS